jgi:hypothetical protein
LARRATKKVLSHNNLSLAKLSKMSTAPGLRCGAAAHSLGAKWPRTQLLPADAVMMAIAAMLMVMAMDADAHAHWADVGADDVGVGDAGKGQGEKRGDKQFHG